MTSFEQWQRQNDQYLSAALHWLRLRLIQMAELSDRATTPRGFLARKMASGSSTVTPAEVMQAKQAMLEAAQMQPPPALQTLSQQFELSPFEQTILLLCAALELDTQMATLCAEAHDNPNWRYPTFALALSCFDEPTWDALSPERPLRYWRLIEIQQGSTQPLTSSALRADERIVNYLKGLNYLDDRLTPFLVSLDVPELDSKALTSETSPAIALPPSQKESVELVLRALEQVDWKNSVIQLVGTDSLSKQLIAQQVATLLNVRLYRLPVELLPAQAGELETLSRLWERESWLLPIALYVDAHEGEGAPAEGYALPLQRFLARSGGLLFVSSRERRSGIAPAERTIEVSKPTTVEQHDRWKEVLGDRAGENPGLLSSQFNLNWVAIGAIAHSTKTEISHLPASEIKSPEELNQHTGDLAWCKCLVYTQPRLDTLAQRLEPKATWQMLVLPDEEMQLLDQIVDQVRHRKVVYQDWHFQEQMNRGLGISALFSGESGTGKTMAAEVIANELQLNLYRIDLSAVVSKYIGETEKNLRRLFDAAEDGGMLLFFDEADALFGRRSEVKDSHDRYANIEVNYLLQRIESYRGLAILATNFKSALDQAFMRRLRFIVNFPFPGIHERTLIWERAFPEAIPGVKSLDFQRLAKLNLTGGSIHNIALNAAFLAVKDGGEVTMPLILKAARTEFRKLERPINEAEFR